MPEIINKSNEQKYAEADVDGFRQDRGPFVVAAETSRMPMVFADAGEAGRPIIFANDSFLGLTGYSRNEVLAQRFDFIFAPSRDAGVLARIQAGFEDGSSGDYEICCRRRDGTEFWAAMFANPVRGEGGEVVQHFASFVDLSAHRQDEADSRMLIDELNHRVKNTLSTVQSIVYQALRTATDVEIIRESIEARLHALSRSHDLLSRQNWQSAGLLDVVREALEPFGVADDRAERFVISGSNIRFPPKAVLALSIAFHELATNAVKYGAFSNEAGSIRIAWTIEPAPEGDRLFLRWQEQDGPPVTPPSRRGFGSRVIERGLAHELEGNVSIDYRPEGVACTIDIPLPPGARSG